ncbi:hypothetical protein [Ilyobacter polytropus]|uniref:Uncharacterized protein n=1 Tax=Ilyobacter polytropus (strain ATCC 51220 / DSM 2926 / LMG 16218 / CuHBu1) TaxID=572544 RepID=E3H7Z5_ILYPC|nr:hypothetical protein [Ilyobacter polytropus]ADO82947.1 hypothetical protein Ilyop_1166 [Ilyobacter polytropus DSM 2926]
MIYFLFLNHPKGEKLYKMPSEKEKMARRYFSSGDMIESDVEIKGKIYRATIDYGVFSAMTNFDCFNCLDTCCGDAPSKFSDATRKLILGNIDEYNNLTKNIDILEELGYERKSIEESIQKDDLMIPEDHIGEEIELCTCAFRPNNSTTLCSAHSICLEKGMEASDILNHKPLICNLWPIEVLAEEDLSMLYITLPDDFTNGFTIEDYYNKACINYEYGTSASFKRTNPEGFHKNDYRPLIVSYQDTIKNSFGEKCYEKIKKKLIEEEFVSEDEFYAERQQLIKRY